MKIEKAKSCDIEKAAKLAIQLWKKNTLDDLTKEFSELIPNTNTAIFLAYENDEAIGFAQCSLRRDYVEGTKSSPVGYFEGIFVIKKHRKKGIGSKLLTACEDWSKAKGCTEFASDCELTNMDSLNFHLKLGFQEANRIICFTKKLDS